MSEGLNQNFRSVNLSPKLSTNFQKLIGKKIINIGVYRYTYPNYPNKEKLKKNFLEEEENFLSEWSFNYCIFFENGLNISIWNPRPILYALFVEFNFDPNEYAKALMKLCNENEEHESQHTSIEFVKFSALEDPEMCSETILSMLNKKVLEVELVKYKHWQGPTPHKSYGSLILHLEDDVNIIVGNSIQSDSDGVLRILPANFLRTEIVDELVSISDLKKVDKYRNYHNDVKLKDTYGFTALREAVYEGNLKLVKKLISKGANVNELDNDGVSILGWAHKRLNHYSNERIFKYRGFPKEVNMKKIIDILKSSGAKE